jgi:beta-lactamase class A
MLSRASKPSRPARPARADIGRAARPWLSLLLLALVAVVISLGPGRLGELISGVRFVRPPAASVPGPALHADRDLQHSLDSVARSLQHGRLAAAIIALGSGATANVDAERPIPAASLFKLPILIEVLAEQDAGLLDPDRGVEIRPEDWTDGSGVLQARVGEQLSVRELTRLMIQESDNIAALVLLDVVGVPAVNARSQALGLSATRVVDRRAGETGEHTTSAADMALLLANLAAGQVVNQHVSEEALRLLELKQSVTWLGDGLPFWVKVAHKWGDLPDARHDAGVVFTPRGSYVVAVLTQDGEADASASAIAEVSRVAYDFLGARP